MITSDHLVQPPRRRQVAAARAARAPRPPRATRLTAVLALLPGRGRAAARTAPAPRSRVEIRPAAEQDAKAIARIAALLGTVAPSGPALVATVEGEVRAALPLDGGRPLADPAHPATALVLLLRAWTAEPARAAVQAEPVGGGGSAPAGTAGAPAARLAPAGC